MHIYLWKKQGYYRQFNRKKYMWDVNNKAVSSMKKESSVDVTCRSEPFSLLHFVRLDFGKMILDQLYKSTYLLDTGVHVYSDSRTNPVSRERHNNSS